MHFTEHVYLRSVEIHLFDIYEVFFANEYTLGHHFSVLPKIQNLKCIVLNFMILKLRLFNPYLFCCKKIESLILFIFYQKYIYDEKQYNW